MTSSLFGDLFDQAEQGDVTTSIPGGTYDLVVTGARPVNPDTSSMIFLTVSVLNGAHQGQTTDVSLYVPKPGDRPFANTMFGRRIRGFLSYPDVKAAGRAMDTAPDRASGFELLAGALTGKQVKGEIAVRTDGAYAGTNELKSTSAPDNVPVVPTVQATQPVAQPVAQPVVSQPVAAVAPQPVAAANGHTSAQVPF